MIRTGEVGGIRLITLDRPEKAGALTEAMLRSLAEAAEDARDAARAGTGPMALVLTGTGKAFSAGMDLEAAKSGLASSPLWERLSGALAEHPGLTVAALNGTCAGGAMGMVLACDLRVAVTEAKLFYPVMRLGFLPQPSDPARLARLVGPARARLLLMAGARVPATEALQWGLVDRIAPPDALVDTARALCGDVLGAAPEHVSAINAMIG